MTGSFPFSVPRDTRPTEPADYELCQQTLHGVRLEDAESAALARWNQKRARVSLRPPTSEMHRIVGADGVTRWFDNYGTVRARTASRDCDRCQVVRLNEELAWRPRPRRSWAWLRLVLAITAVAASWLALALR